MSNDPLAPFIEATCDHLKAFLLEKNAAYGNSVGDPINVFAKGSPYEQMAVRIDDKLSRLKRGHEFPGDDTIKDLAGYLILWMAIKEAEQEGPPEDIVVSTHSLLFDGSTLRHVETNQTGVLRATDMAGVFSWDQDDKEAPSASRWVDSSCINKFIVHTPFG